MNMWDNRPLKIQGRERATSLILSIKSRLVIVHLVNLESNFPKNILSKLLKMGDPESPFIGICSMHLDYFSCWRF